MNIITLKKYITPMLLSALLLFGTFTIVLADHSEEEASVEINISSDSSEIASMQALIAVLQELVALLQKQTTMTDAQMDSDTHDHSAHMHDVESDDLTIWIEVHSFRTHAHVQNGDDLDTFFIDDHEYTEEEAVAQAVAAKTGIDIDVVRDVITFPSGKLDENGDSVSEDGSHDHGSHESHGNENEESLDLDGIHIMGDGSVMLGNGEPVSDASVNDDGMIVLSDGTVVEPAFDLR